MGEGSAVRYGLFSVLSWPLVRAMLILMVLSASCRWGVELYYQSWDFDPTQHRMSGSRWSVVLDHGDLLIGSVRTLVPPSLAGPEVVRRERGPGLALASQIWDPTYMLRGGFGGLGPLRQPIRVVCMPGLRRIGAVSSPTQGDRIDTSIEGFAIPWWLIAALVAAPVGWAIFCYDRGRARAERGLCSRCGYDMRATPERCPECGMSGPSRGEVARGEQPFGSCAADHLPWEGGR